MRTSVPSLLDHVVFGRSYQRVARALSAFSSLVLPSSCVVCGRWDTSLCPACVAVFRAATARPVRAEDGAESLPDVEQITADAGGMTAVAGGRGPVGEDEPFSALPVVAAGSYGRAVSAVLLAYKNHGHVDLAAPVGAALGGALHEAASRFGQGRRSTAESILLVPVPTRASSRRRRGYDPLMLLLARLDRGGHLPAGTVLASDVRQVPPGVRFAAALQQGDIASRVGAVFSAVVPALHGGQKGLGRRRRRINVLGSMCPVERTRHALVGRDCIIVDDVLTTGATIGEVHRVLVAAGARVLGAAVIAATSSPAGRAPGVIAARAPGVIAGRAPGVIAARDGRGPRSGCATTGHPANYRNFRSGEG